jgi:hypothetical protein
MADQYDKAKHTELSIKKATSTLSEEEEKQLQELRKQKALEEALAGKNR